MYKIISMTKLLNEQDFDDLVSKTLSDKELFDRINQITRTAKMVERAINKAKSTNRSPELISKLENQLDKLNTLLNDQPLLNDEQSSDTDTDNENEDGDAESDSNSSSSGKENNSEDDADGNSDNNDENSEDSDKKEETPNEEPESDEDTNSDKTQSDQQKQTDNNLDDARQGMDNSQKDQQDINKNDSGANGSSGKGNNGDQMKQSDNSDDNQEDSEASNGEQNSKSSSTNKNNSSQSKNQSSDTDNETVEGDQAGEEDQENNSNENQSEDSNDASEDQPNDQSMTIEELKKALAKASSNQKRGAFASVKAELARNGIYIEHLTVSGKKVINEAAYNQTIDTMSAEQFDQVIADALELVDKVFDVQYSDDLEARVKEINDIQSSASANKELEREDSMNLQADEKARVKARAAEKTKYTGGVTIGSTKDFEIDFFKAIADQVKKVRLDKPSWSALDRKFEDDPSMLVKGNLKTLQRQQNAIPTIAVFFDQSGSWDSSDVARGRSAIASIKQFEDQGKLKLDIYYFSNILTNNDQDPGLGGGTRAWNLILNQIKLGPDGGNGPYKNVLIMTDDDMEGQAENNPDTVYVDGCVWLLWKRGQIAPTITKRLRGRQTNNSSRSYRIG